MHEAYIRLVDQRRAAWQNRAQACRVQTVDMLAARGLSDEAVVTIDVRPEAFPNVIDVAAGGRLTVAIFSTAGFDATAIVPGSLRLASSSTFGAADHRSSTQARAVDVNGDGRADLLLEFDIDRGSAGARRSRPGSGAALEEAWRSPAPTSSKSSGISRRRSVWWRGAFDALRGTIRPRTRLRATRSGGQGGCR